MNGISSVSQHGITGNLPIERMTPAAGNIAEVTCHENQ